MYRTLFLRAEDESTLAAALPMLRRDDPETGGVWLTAWDGGACDPIGPLAVTLPALDSDGATVTPPTIDPRYHLNLCLRDGGPLTAAIMAAAAPFVIAPNSPRRTFA